MNSFSHFGSSSERLINMQVRPWNAVSTEFPDQADECDVERPRGLEVRSALYASQLFQSRKQVYLGTLCTVFGPSIWFWTLDSMVLLFEITFTCRAIARVASSCSHFFYLAHSPKPGTAQHGLAAACAKVNTTRLTHPHFWSATSWKTINIAQLGGIPRFLFPVPVSVSVPVPSCPSLWQSIINSKGTNAP